MIHRLRARLALRRRGQILLSVIALLAAIPFTAEPLLLWLSANDRLMLSVMTLAYGVPTVDDSGDPAPAQPARAMLALDQTVARVDPKFLSFAVDTSQVVGGHWWSDEASVELGKGANRTAPFDFDRPRLRLLAEALAPAYLRIGGTEADEVRYELGAEASDAEDLVLTRGQVDSIAEFASEAGLRLFMTVNAGPLDRRDGAWVGEQAERLMAYMGERSYPVDVWEFGNEANVFWFTHGLGHHLSAAQYSKDLRRFSKLVQGHFPAARVAAAGAFLQPVMGEPPPRMLPDLLPLLGSELDVLTWHYYPQQSRRCWSATRRARTGLLLAPEHLSEFDRLSGYVNGLRDRHAAGAEVWLGETGGAQCGGEPGISDRFESSLWWVDQLGRAARSGQPVVVRQTLAGAHYGMLDSRTLEPRPDYWASLLWKRLMGERVLAAQVERNERVRMYAHCTPRRAEVPAGSVTLLLLNLHPTQPVSVELANVASQPAQLYAMTAPSLDSDSVALNGAPLQLARGDRLPELSGTDLQVDAEGDLTLAPASFAYLVLPEAAAEACGADVPA